MNKNRSLPFYEGVEHTPEDIRKRWRGTNVLFCDMDGNQFPVYINEIDDRRVYYTNTISERNNDVLADGFFVAKEFPPMGVFSAFNTVYHLSRTQDRQWKRGACPDTTVIEALTPAIKPFDFERLVAEAFLFVPTPFELAIKTVKEGEPKAISRHLWMSARDNTLASLYYDDVFVGYVDKDKNFISHSESITLAEEAVNELGLHAI